MANRYLTPEGAQRVKPSTGFQRRRPQFSVKTDFYTTLPRLLEETRDMIRQSISLTEGNVHIAIPVDICEWAEERFYIPGTASPIVLAPHQKAILRLAFTRNPETSRLPFRLVIYSTIKKSGKSTIAGLIAQWYAETQQRHSDLYAIGNDREQAKLRSFREVRTSIELTPGYDINRKRLPGEWDLGAAETMRCTRTGSEIRALAVDAKGESGGHPAISIWTELWGFEHEAAKLFWDELTPVPTIPDSMRIVETYAGFLQQSQLLYSLYENGLEGHQLTAGELSERTGCELGVFAEAPNAEDLVPIWVNDASSTMMYWDEGLQARRMPWQQGPDGEAYYREQESSLHPLAFDRLHGNKWTSAETAFIQPEWWDACYDASLVPLLPGDRTPLVIGVDAATTGDCFAIVVVSRHPVRPDEVAVRAVKIIDPKERGGRVDYDEAEEFLRFVCGGGCVNRHPRTAPHAGLAWETNHPDKVCSQCAAQDWAVPAHNVVQIAYDPYQLEDMMQSLRRDSVAWCAAFPQTQDRLKSDRALYDAIVRRLVWHNGNQRLRDHILNAGARLQKDEDSTLRLIKVSQSRKIDGAVALSMAAARCKYLRI